MVATPRHAPAVEDVEAAITGVVALVMAIEVDEDMVVDTVALDMVSDAGVEPIIADVAELVLVMSPDV
ncbi:hypothetical protein MMC19_000228 [Ptychographa xylographoides]|nr:hypothetical protein [Ptychographa xylographoides]